MSKIPVYRDYVSTKQYAKDITLFMNKDDITVILARIGEGNEQAVDALMPFVYDELHRMAGNKIRYEKHNQTLNATALVHEAYLKLVDQKNVNWQNRAHFFAIAARAMRRIIINYAKEKIAQKRGGGAEVITLNEDTVGFEIEAEDLLTLEDALKRLEKMSERQSKVVEYWLFVGLTHEEIAELLNISVPSVRRDWRLARAWLSKECKDLEFK
jgi:RNA polymerase sigma factor (TIGR02999 family)